MHTFRMELFRTAFTLSAGHLKTYGRLLRAVRDEYEDNFKAMKREIEFAAREKKK